MLELNHLYGEPLEVLALLNALVDLAAVAIAQHLIQKHIVFPHLLGLAQVLHSSAGLVLVAAEISGEALSH